MNRIFPGDPRGSIAENTAYNIIEDLKGADLVLDIHSSDVLLYEVAAGPHQSADRGAAGAAGQASESGFFVGA